jgi:multicomponent Na+:H+ antiporter subunit G
MKDILTALLLLSGSFFALVSAVGVFRFPDLFTRMHASSKAGTLGGGLIMTALAIHFQDPRVTIETLLIISFIISTAPIAAHVIARAAYMTGEPLCKESVIDELKKPAGGTKEK